VKADYIMVGGFLGAGKTTALLRLAHDLTARGRRVGLIVNDQSSGLVDTVLVESHGYPVEEITGGCFCCRFDSLTAAAERLTEAVKPDVFLAEPVGSCTDLRASVEYPLRRLYGEHYRIAPLTVLVDPVRARRIIGLERGKAFSPKVLYVYSKQLEEADLIAINKGDLLGPEELQELQNALQGTYRQAEVFTMSARTGAGLDRWFDCLAAEADFRPAPDVDYDMYAEGEALLGWFNATFHLASATPFDGNRLLRNLAHRLAESLTAFGLEIAHFKATLTPDENIGDLGALNLVSGDRRPELSHLLQDELSSGELIVNLRAEGAPDALRDGVIDALTFVSASAGISWNLIHMEHFRPARPSPTYRLATVEG
jgi:G3E family GTPase